MSILQDGKTKPYAIIDNWIVVQGPYLIGRISNHPHQRNFKSNVQVTSKLVSINYDAGYDGTQKTIYIVGSSRKE